ncbi:alpha-1,2-mannosyltransferase ALG9-like [Penaeus chinensis]|uniref:alpha-1,2-mannosyltransferase ALG9-like n=1 Tax=Penaeus chinensis TaxID=139456 RepID=UPI001FB7161F|nr:alpha-1,2-mannosyltransferase ALG9-like [Penaeus chinensis]
MAPTARNRANVHTRKELQKEILKRQANNKESSKEREDTAQNIIAVVEPWTPGAYTALKALLSARLCAAIWALINDCDETYNYWEPTHYLLYGKGFQTWEYAPQYALRSYTYILIHAVPGWIYSNLLQSNRMLVFFFIRCMLALGCSGCELYFYRGICKEFGANVGRLTLSILVFAAGMFIASTAYLPSSFAMYMTFMSMGAWYHQSYELAIFTTAISTFLGWPFAAAIGIPIAYDIVFRKQQIFMFVKWCIISMVTILVPMVQIDSHYFGSLVIAPLNIVKYNIFTSHGPDLYGTEPWSFYMFNGFLNFNIVFLAALASLPMYTLVSYLVQLPKKSSMYLPLWLTLSPLYLWLLVFILQPHKEERFLFPVYPLICLAGAITIDCCQKLGSFLLSVKRQHYLHHTNWFAICIVILTSVLSLSRIVGQYRAYHAPLETFMELNRLAVEENFPTDRPINLCVGKEWHRFPSSFFLPGLNWNLQFIESEFRGQLPQPYSEAANGTLVIPENMNDMNREEESRYISLSSCHFLIDLDSEEETEREPRYTKRTTDWITLHSVPFMDAQRSPRLLRAFYVPFVTEQHCSYFNYTLMQSTKWKPKSRYLGRL